MILNATVTPKRAARSFDSWTRISLQVRGGATVYISKEQGEAGNQNDGAQLTQASTNPPYDCWWKGELWYSASVDNSPLIILIIGNSDDYRP